VAAAGAGEALGGDPGDQPDAPHLGAARGEGKGLVRGGGRMPSAVRWE